MPFTYEVINCKETYCHSREQIIFPVTVKCNGEVASVYNCESTEARDAIHKRYEAQND
jgi:hypothetical protein